jgi:putative phage-type endonuclease
VVTALIAPPAELVGFFKPGTPDWHAARENRVGGSEVAALLRMSKWESLFSLWHRKKGLIGPKAQNAEMEAGTRLEPAICRKFADMHPEFVTKISGTYCSVARPCDVANPDRLLFDADGDQDWPVALLEAKFALYPDDWGTEGTDEIPPYYKIQVRHYLGVFGLFKAYVEVFIGSTGEFREYVVYADPDETARMQDAIDAFMASLADDIRPDIDEHSATYDTVRELHPDIDDEDYEVPAHIAIPYTNAVDAAKQAEQDKSQAAAVLLDAMGRRRRAWFLGEQIAMRIPGRGDSPPFLKAMPAKTSDVKATAP